MPQSVDTIYLHLVFSTKNREPWLVGDHLSAMHRYLATVSRDLNAPAVQVGGVADHVHLLTRFPRTLTVAEWVNKLKSNSSRWFKEQSATRDHAGFAWQKGYGVFSISVTHVDAAKAYIEHQEAHHKKITFQDEYRDLMNKHGIEFDERYVWD